MNNIKMSAVINEASSTREKIFLSAINLFSEKGYSGVGIRELCRSVNIKESAFYNHFSGKEALLNKIFTYYKEKCMELGLADEEMKMIIEKADVRFLFEFMMKKFASVTDNLLFFTIRKILISEGFITQSAGEILLNNLYYIRAESMEHVLKAFIEKGIIRECDTASIVREYFYGLMGLLDEYMLIEQWNKDLTEINDKILKHIEFYLGIFKI